mgnify:CR=1 FL=1
MSVSALKIRRTRAEGTRAYLEDAVPDTSMHGDIRAERVSNLITNRV